MRRISKQQVSQKRVAEIAGVSQATVSLVLSGRGVSAQDTQRRVLKAAEQLKYRPNLLVHGIQTGKTRMIGVMAPPMDFYWSQVLYGIHDVLVAHDHVPITLWTKHSGPGVHERTGYEVDELDQIHRLLDRRVDGVILWPPFASLFSEHVHEFSSRDLPIVTIDHQLPAEFKADSVGSDEAAGGRLISEHLLKLGHQVFGHLAGSSVASWAVRRRRGFEQALARSPEAHCTTIEAPAGDVAQALVQARELLALNPRPTAIFAATDLYAKCVYQAAAEAGVRIPQDLSVVGFSDDDFAAEMNPPLTTVRQPAYEIGRKAAELVLGRSLGELESDEIQHVYLPVKLIIRDSTSAPQGRVKVTTLSKLARAEARV